MDEIIAENGQVVTEEMIDGWCEALDRDEWPKGWRNVGEIVDGKPSQSASGTETLSVKVPSAMKKAIDREAKDRGMTTSVYVRGVLAESLMASSS